MRTQITNYSVCRFVGSSQIGHLVIRVLRGPLQLLRRSENPGDASVEMLSQHAKKCSKNVNRKKGRMRAQFLLSNNLNQGTAVVISFQGYSKEPVNEN